jgi:hypothetical protein
MEDIAGVDAGAGVDEFKSLKKDAVDSGCWFESAARLER